MHLESVPGDEKSLNRNSVVLQNKLRLNIQQQNKTCIYSTLIKISFPSTSWQQNEMSSQHFCLISFRFSDIPHPR